jgi:hypothetical protein
MSPGGRGAWATTAADRPADRVFETPVHVSKAPVPGFKAPVHVSEA